jgi:hypothetical protein
LLAKNIKKGPFRIKSVVRGMWRMSKEQMIEELCKEIELKRMELNRMVVDNVDKEALLKFSVELDNLIKKFYELQLN